MKDDTEGVTDVVGSEFLEALGAITALKEKSVPHGSLSELLLQIPRLAGEDDWGKRREGLED